MKKTFASLNDPGNSSAGGTAHRVIAEALGDVHEYSTVRFADPVAYAAWVELQLPDTFGLNLDQLSLSTRFPLDEEAYVDEALAKLQANEIIATTDYPKADFAEYQTRVAERWDHGGHLTYIFPEEARLLFALGYLLDAKEWLFGGSYYGYWAIWAAPGVASQGGQLTLVDIDEAVTALAERNFASVFPSVDARFRVSDATGQLAPDESIDVFVLDAEGPKDHPQPELRDKAIYAPIMHANSRTLRPGALLIAHNMLLDNRSDCAYFAAKVEHNRRQYEGFSAHLAHHYDRQVLLTSSEGVGVYRRSVS